MKNIKPNNTQEGQEIDLINNQLSFQEWGGGRGYGK